MTAIKESDLYQPVKDYLTALGYDVKGEVKHCDITALLGDELVIVELKRNFTLELLYQAMERQSITPLVYVAVPLPKDGYQKRYKHMVKLCKRLGIGLLLVGFSQAEIAMVDVASHPEQTNVRQNKKKKEALLSEHQSRTGSHNIGGVTRRKILTVYKEQTLQVARLLKEHGPLTPAQARQLGGSSKTASMFRQNFYGWFEKHQDKAYALSQQGLDALEEYRELFE